MNTMDCVDNAMMTTSPRLPKYIMEMYIHDQMRREGKVKMTQVVKLVELGVYEICDFEDGSKMSRLNDMINGWPEKALHIRHTDALAVLNIDTTSDLALWCDSDGHPKGLGLTTYRITDGHPLVGPCIWTKYIPTITEDGPDFRLNGFTEGEIKLIKKALKGQGWAELVFEEK